MKKVFTTIALAFFAVGLIPALFLVACSEKEHVSLRFASESYRVEAGGNDEIAIEAGNGSYSTQSEDESVVLAGYSVTGKKSPGKLILTGVAPGQTWVTVTDKISNEETRLLVTVAGPQEAADDL